MQMRIVVGSLVILASMMTAAVAGYFSSQQMYYTVNELFADPAFAAGTARGAAYSNGLSALPERRVQLRGEVDYGSVERPDEGLRLTFNLVGSSGSVEVEYAGIVPDTFEQAETVTVGGRFSADGTFAADQLFVQCPSKYEAEPPGVSAAPDG